jgi:uncharacterized protein (DUF305 family)
VNKDTVRFAILLILISSVTLAAWQQEDHSSRRTTVSGPQWSELAESVAKMHGVMASAEPSGNSDVDFVKLMLPHHQAAIEMARTQLMYGKDPQMRRLAQEIIADQQSEIELMQLWLKEHGPSSLKQDRNARSSREQ